MSGSIQKTCKQHKIVLMRYIAVVMGTLLGRLFVYGLFYPPFWVLAPQGRVLSVPGQLLIWLGTHCGQSFPECEGRNWGRIRKLNFVLQPYIVSDVIAEHSPD